MSDVAEYAPRTLRKIPEHWPGLLSLAQSALPTQPHGVLRASSEIHELGHAIEELDLQTLNESKYYAYSMAICGMARALHEPATQEVVVERGATMLLEGSQRSGGGVSGLYTEYVELGRAFGAPIHAGYNSLAPEEQLLGNYLRIAEDERIDRAHTHMNPLDPLEWLDAQIYSLRKEWNAGLGSETSMTSGLKYAATLSVAYIFSEIFDNKIPNWKQGELPDESVLDMLRSPKLSSIANKLCTLSSGASIGYEGKVIEVTGDDVSFVDPYRNRKEPQAIVPDPHIYRSDSLMCPALHVRGMIGLTLGTCVDIVERAVDKLGAEAA